VGSTRFGEYSRNLKGGHHGAFFLNSTGTPVLAAADGTVVLAGDDAGTPLGPYKNLYGNLVIIQHDLPGFSEPVFTLYGHLAEVLVQANDAVAAGQEIGKVGMSGDVSGSTLVFEVRMGANEYASARNPGLWLEPLPGENGDPLGALAGRILDASGKLLTVPNITLEQLAGPGLPAARTLYLKTYSESGLSGQSPWGENFASWDLTPGEYQISFWLDGLHQRVVEIQPGKLTLVTFQVP
jgi:murein DD-endopeptidase MepM/ murein hydrolase activator NlpD